MSYNALYREYRPTSFSGIVGQNHITAILKSQIRNSRVAHAYLFSGTRGTGKTSTARILAKAINCLDPIDGEPCGKCEACMLNVTDSIDVIEMDAASNSKVDEMRSLLEKAELAPIYLKTKVYIIDEAHMLSKSANNALLKTLEEPPAHVVFILATTEPQALPATILSRCQRFDFRRLSVTDMVERTKSILKDAGYHIDDDGLMCIARAADGGMRDCLSIADQCLSFCGKDISCEDVLSVLGSMNTDFMFGFADAVIKSDTASVLRLVDKVVESGRDIPIFVQDLANHFRSLLITKVCGDCSDIIDCTKETMAQFLEQAGLSSKERLERALDELMQLQPKLRWVMLPRVLLESTLMRICRPDLETGYAALADRLNELERRLSEASLTVNAPKKAIEVGESGADKANDKDDGKKKNKEDNRGRNEAVFSVPAATPRAEELYKGFMAALMKTDVMLGIQLQLASAHWCDDDNLYICFDKSRSSNYNYANGSEARTKLRRAAGESIAPLDIELVLKDGKVTADENVPTEILGVNIVEE